MQSRNRGRKREVGQTLYLICQLTTFNLQCYLLAQSNITHQFARRPVSNLKVVQPNVSVKSCLMIHCLKPGHSCFHHNPNTVVRRLTTGIRYEKCVVRRFRRCANVIECTYTNLDSIAYYTPRLYGTAYCC